MNISNKQTRRRKRPKEEKPPLLQYCSSLKTKYRPNKRVLFIQIPQFILKSFNLEIARKKGYYAYPPTGLQCLYSALKNRDLDLRILDLNFLLLKKVTEDEGFDHRQWMAIVQDYLKAFRPFIIGISCMYDAGIQPLLEILEFLKQDNESVVVTGGVIASYEWRNLLKRDLCHFVVKGEGENKINYLFDQLTDNQRHPAANGIYYKYQNKYLQTQGESDIVELSGNLIDSYSLIPIEEYYQYASLNPFSRMAGVDSAPFAAIQMSRGCRGRCTFCSVRDFMGRGVRKREVDTILQEMEFLINQRGVRHFEWLDDDLLFFKKDFQTLMEKIIEQKWKITWSANNGLIAASVDEETMRLIRDSGCLGFKLGIETGNAQMLKKIRKPASLDSFREVSSVFNNYPEVFVGGNFMLGLPNEEFRQMLDSFRFYLELKLDWAAFTICQMLRGAGAFADWTDYFAAQINQNDGKVRNFIPARDDPDGQLTHHRGNLLTGLDVFKISPQSLPDAEQIKEIWFTFNLVGNYINNKNLKPGGRVDKFINWVEMAQLAYPTNAYMSLFLSLAYIIKGERAKSREYYNKVTLCQQSDYWRERMASFGLTEVLDSFPETESEVFKTMENLRKSTAVI